MYSQQAKIEAMLASTRPAYLRRTTENGREASEIDVPFERTETTTM
jgi:hypothetical protein